MPTRPVARLPGDVTSFVARRWSTTQVKQLLSTSRLVTLTGVAGVGKSRLALQVARDLRRVYPDGVWLIELGRLDEPKLVAHVVAEGLGLREQTPVSPEDVLLEELRDKRSLLVLDGCEHLLDEVGLFVLNVLAAAPDVRIPSREPLGIVGEHTWPVPPMSTRRTGPDGHQKPEALVLFEDRASAVSPGFSIGPDNETLVTRLCQQRDGLPLAIELAAVWMRSLSLEEILDRLTDRYRLLTMGHRSAVPHHRTLRAAIEWSFDWCSPTDQENLALVAVFQGDPDHAVVVCQRSLQLCQGRGEQWVRSWTELVLGVARWRQGNSAEAAEHLKECLRLKQAFNDNLGLLITMEMLAWTESSHRHPVRSARLFAAVSQLWRPVGTYLFGMEKFRCWHAECWARVQAALRPEELREASIRGAALTQDEAVTYALGRHRPAQDDVSANPDSPGARGRRAGGARVVEPADRGAPGDRQADLGQPHRAHSHQARLHLAGTDRAWVAEQGQET